MKNIFNSLLIAFGLYSKIPMPIIEWKKDNLKFAMCFLPIIGIIIYFLINIWYIICIKLNISNGLFAAISTVIPIIITGGIHFDGFIDTCDAVNSYADKEKKIEILKDVHIGAFALIMSNAYFIVCFGLWFELYSLNNIKLAFTMGIISRIIGGGTQLFFKCIKNSGLAYIFSSNADKNKVKTIYILYVLIYFAIVIYKFDFTGILLLISILIAIIYFKKFIDKNFGGINGDLCGWVLQMTELIVLFVCTLGGIFCA